MKKKLPIIFRHVDTQERDIQKERRTERKREREREKERGSEGK